jgi:hypothetical protein
MYRNNPEYGFVITLESQLTYSQQTLEAHGNPGISEIISNHLKARKQPMDICVEDLPIPLKHEINDIVLVLNESLDNKWKVGLSITILDDSINTFKRYR